MAEARRSCIDLEQRRLQLEQNITKLRASLRYWQQWELEYEGMKEEILCLEAKSTGADLESLGEDSANSFLGGSDSVLLTPKERKLLLVDDKGRSRDCNQVLGLLSRRTDYVQQNVKTVSSLLQTAEQKCAASQLLPQPEVQNEEGLPLTEIHEELDEEGKEVSSSTSQPRKIAPQLAQVFRKAGIKDLPEILTAPKKPKVQPKETALEESALSDNDNTAARSQIKVSETNELHQSLASASDSTKNLSKRESSEPRKRVSFADGTKMTSDHKKVVSLAEAPVPLAPVEQSLSEDLAQMQNEAMQIILSNDSLTEQEKNRRMSNVLGQAKTLHSGTSTSSWPAADRKTALSTKPPAKSSRIETVKPAPSRNAVSKVQTVPAKSFVPVIPPDDSLEDANLRRLMIQYNMEEVGAVVAELDVDEDEISYPSDDEENYAENNSSAEEDEDEFGRTKRRVISDNYIAEMKILEGRLKNVGSVANIDNVAQAIRKTEHQQPLNGMVVHGQATGKKGARAANELAVQGTPSTTTKTTSRHAVEHNSPPKTISKPVLASVIERPFTASASDNPDFVPAEPGEYEPALVQQEVAMEYHKMRNRMIQRQGGFMPREKEKAEVPLTEAEGGPKKMSRFKAARLGKV